jgi:indole-3-glycerol phosphate synthase
MKLILLATTAIVWTTAQAFCPSSAVSSNVLSSKKKTTSSSSSSLYAVGALVKKAKEASLRQYIAEGIEDSVMEQYKIIKDALENDKIDLTTSQEVDQIGPLQQTLTRRKGTITVIAEYKRKLADSGYIKDVFEPEILSREFREFGAAGIAVLADERMGGCTYEDLKAFVEDQRRSQNLVPGPVLIINSDLIIDELQIARSAAYGASAVVLTWDVLGDLAQVEKLLKAAKAVDLEVIVAISSREEAQQAIDLGARMISVVNVPGVEEKTKVITDLKLPDKQTVTFIANIMQQYNKGLGEVEEAWGCRDKGFNCAWISDALYKAGNSEVEHPGAIIKSMASKSSVKWASPVARSGRGEGAREYLGDILM